MATAEEIVAHKEHERLSYLQSQRELHQAALHGAIGAEETLSLQCWKEIRTTALKTIDTLAANDYKGGWLYPVVTRYEPKRNWFGMRYHMRVTVDKVLWRLHDASYRRGIVNATHHTINLGSDGNLYADNEVMPYVDPKGRVWSPAIYQIDEQSDLTLDILENILQGLRDLQISTLRCIR